MKRVLVWFLFSLLAMCVTLTYKKLSDGPVNTPGGEVLSCALPADLWVLFPKPWA